MTHLSKGAQLFLSPVDTRRRARMAKKIKAQADAIFACLPECDCWVIADEAVFGTTFHTRIICEGYDVAPGLMSQVMDQLQALCLVHEQD